MQIQKYRDYRLRITLCIFHINGTKYGFLLFSIFQIPIQNIVFIHIFCFLCMYAIDLITNILTKVIIKILNTN